MSSVDFGAASTASVGLGGGGGRGRGGRGGKGHYTPKVGVVSLSFGALTFVRSSHFRPRSELTFSQGDFVTSTTLAIEAKKTNTADVQHVVAEHPVRRQIIWRKNRETDLSKHGSYGIAVEVQARGNHNATPCNSCARGAGPFKTGCVSFSSGYGPGNKIPFGGACANCFWGGQGGRCTLRVGGGKFPSSFPLLLSRTDLWELAPVFVRAPCIKTRPVRTPISGQVST
jgi:hypothetical protein